MRLRPAGPAWPWFAVHGCAALTVLVILRLVKQAYIRSAHDLAWTIAAALVLALATLTIGAPVAVVLRQALRKEEPLSLLWAISSLAILFLLSIFMIIQA